MKRRRSLRKSKPTGKGRIDYPCVTLPDGTGLHYRERGAGPDVILLHGGMGDLRSWGPQVAAFGRRFRVIAYSRRASYPNVNPFRIATDPAASDAADLDAFMQGRGIEHAHLVGTSYGALVALRFALCRPSKTLSLSLCEPPLHAWVKEFAGDAASHDRFMRVWNAAAEYFGSRRFTKAMILLSRAFGEGAVRPARLGSRSLLQNAEAMRRLALASDPFARLDPVAIERLRTPMLVMRGERSDELHQLGVAELVRRAAGCREAVISAAGHRAQVENPAEFNRVVLGFLGSLPVDVESAGSRRST